MAEIDTEICFVGGCFNGSATNENLSESMGLVDPEMIKSKKLASVYSACCRVFGETRKSSLVDEITVFDSMKRNDDLSCLGETPKHELCTITSLGAFSGENLVHYAKIIVEDFKKIRLAELSRRVISSANSAGETIGQAETEMRAISLLGDEKKISGIGELLRSQMVELQRLYQEKKIEGMVTTGFYDLDECIMGMMPGDMCILAGRPSMGKTAFAVAVACNVAKTEPVFFFSLEMNKDQLISRMLSSESNVDATMVSSPWRINDAMWPKLANASGRLDSLKLSICDETRMTTNQMRTQMEKASRKTGIKLVVIDYLQLLRSNAKAFSREREVAEISSDLKAIAKDFKIPVLCLAQLNRATEAGTDKRPKLSNLRESGSLEQDADKVLFVHRENYYDPRADKNEAEILVAKNRTGPGAGDRVLVGWDASKVKFYNRAKESKF